MSEAELASLKSTLRSLVVSSPTRVDLRTLLRDYRSLIGEPLPLNRFGYRDPLTFLKERCADSFLGMPSNPLLTLIVPETLKHIDKFVQNQKSTHLTKLKGKRTSIPQHVSQGVRQDNTIVSTYNHKNLEKKVDCNTTTTNIEKPRDSYSGTQSQLSNSKEESYNKCGSSCNSRAPQRRLSDSQATDSPGACSSQDNDRASSQDNHSSAHTSSSQGSSKQAQLEELKDHIHTLIKDSQDGVWCKDLMMRYQERYGNVPELTRFGFTTIVSLVQTLSDRVRVTRVLGGDWLLQDVAAPPRSVLVPAGPAASAGPPRRPAAAPAKEPASRAARDEDALPGVPYAPDVFPADCLQFEETVPPADISALRPGLNLEVIVGEVYSPSHFWLIRLGPDYNIAMEELMDEMTEYFEKGEGRKRYLATAALRVGQYCAALYDRDWHRAIIVDLLDGEDLVKVRHVDYGTVDTVSASTLRPLPRRWARLPMQAVRARQAGVRPAAHGRRWLPAASTYFLRLVRDRPLIASIVAIDVEEATLEAFLVDTSQDEDDDLARDLVRSGYADERRDSALTANDCYLYPVFSAIESGATPNYAEIQRYLHDGVTLDYVPAFRRHVPAALPPLEPEPAAAVVVARSPSPPPSLSPPPTPPPPPLTRVPLLRPVSPPPSAPAARTSKPATPTTTLSPAPTSAPAPTPSLASTSALVPTFAPAPHPMQNASSYHFLTPQGLSVPPPEMPPRPTNCMMPPPLLTNGMMPLPLLTNVRMPPPSPFEMVPSYSMPGNGAGMNAGPGSGELLLSATDWAMYEQLTATAHWFKMAAVRRARIAAAAAAPPPPFPPHSGFTSGPPPGFF